MELGSGATVMESTRMIADTGRTEDKDSFSFSMSIVLFFIWYSPFRRYFLCRYGLAGGGRFVICAFVRRGTDLLFQNENNNILQ